MSDAISNRNGDHIRFHAELETEEAALPYHQLPEYQRFEKHWTRVCERIKQIGGVEPNPHERNVAENWFLWGFFDGMVQK